MNKNHDHKKSEIDFGQMILFLSKLEKLKSITRHSWTSSGRHESVAEHCWRLTTFLFILRGYLENYDFQKMIAMALFHDLGEVKYGDIPSFNKTSEDITNEENALTEIKRDFQDIGISDIVTLIEEFNRNETKEANFVNALDKIEAVIQHNEADLKTWIEKEYTLNVTYGFEECQEIDILRKLREAIKKQTLEKIKDRES